jgi:TonB family protein
MQEIERDLIRWRRGKWMTVIGGVSLLQLGLLLWASKRDLPSQKIYPAEPQVALAERMQSKNYESLELENPFLFAAASQNGFSSEAWLRQPTWQLPEPRNRARPDFLQLADAREMSPTKENEREFSLIPTRRSAAVFPIQEIPSNAPTFASELSMEGFRGRKLAVPIALPVQQHSDVLSSTVVEALIDRDGLVISVRILENSGSARADGDALALARRARFKPSKSAENVPEMGKLIFEWVAVSLSDTNNVKR